MAAYIRRGKGDQLIEKPVVYLAGPIAGCSEHGIHAWRDALKENEELAERYTFLDPTSNGLFQDGCELSEAIVSRDKEMIRRSDIVIVNTWKTSVGTTMEMLYAYEQGKIVVLAEPPHLLGTVRNPWYNEHLHCVTGSDTIAAFFFTSSFYKETTVSDSGRGYWISTDEGPVYVSPKLLTLADSLLRIATEIHILNEKWWRDTTNAHQPIFRNYGELLMLAVSELGESINADRKDANDDHLPNQLGRDVELFDCVIRLLDIALGKDMNFSSLAEKLAYNAVREDHKHENRIKDGGKKF